MTDKEKTIKELKEALDSLDITNKYRLNIIRAIEYLQEESVSEGLEEASKEWLIPQLDKSYANYGEAKMMELTHFDGYAMLDAIEFGAQWKEQQFEKNRLAACDKQTKEEADVERDFVMGIIEKEHRQPTFDDAIKYGMRKMKEQMMAKAVDGEITNAGGTFGYDVASFKFDDNHSFQVLLPTDRKSKFGDKVKIIVIKEN